MTPLYPSTATLEEAETVVASIRQKLTHANGEWAVELHEDLVAWERAVDRLTRLAAQLDEWRARLDAEAEEEDRRFEQHRDDQIMAKYEGGHRG